MYSLFTLSCLVVERLRLTILQHSLADWLAGWRTHQTSPLLLLDQHWPCGDSRWSASKASPSSVHFSRMVFSQTQLCSCLVCWENLQLWRTPHPPDITPPSSWMSIDRPSIMVPKTLCRSNSHWSAAFKASSSSLHWWVICALRILPAFIPVFSQIQLCWANLQS